MSKKDVFVGIAAGGVSKKADKLKETLPPERPEEIFKETKEALHYHIKKDYESNLKDFRKGLGDLKKQYAPYIQQKCSSLKSTRVKKYLTDFTFGFEDNTELENVQIPHYTGPKGRWTAQYETEFGYSSLQPDRRVFLVFKGVDYYADVFVNNIHVCSHEGFFAPFECDVTKYLRETNTLMVKVRNDIPTIGNGDMQKNGDKLYAATGLGWDDPEEGWHHCPAGGGIFDKVYLEERDSLYIDDIFVRPDIDAGTAEVNISIFSPSEENREIDISGNIMPYNFAGLDNGVVSMKVTVGYGLNFYKYTTTIQEFKIWEPDYPYMYVCRITIGTDSMEKTFGMRKFHMDEEDDLKGSLFLNNKPIMLRGANEMGHLQLCVMREDYDQLIEDILIAKYCNMNYYRITQRPVQEEIYHYCDMLGMLNQADLPLFGYMRKNKFLEGVKQAGEMERLIRNHPSVIMSTYINEPFSPDKYGLGYRHMSRPELELFFDACDAAVYFENPDRVIKRVEGDYDPPTNKGMSDFHCYNMWYTNHALPIGMLYKGYLPALKEGWKTGCGEYGTEGLDNYDVMRKYYPSAWLPENDCDEWIPDKIIKAQTNTMHGDWYEEQDNIHNWINKSQEHQAFSTGLMTLAMRRRSDKIVSTAIHLLIDAWPSGWMKTLLDVDRVPKKAYFAFKESLQPLTVNLRCDRWSAYSGESFDVEIWILNDRETSANNLKIITTIFYGANAIKSFSKEIDSFEACTSKAVGLVNFEVPDISEYTEFEIQACIFENEAETSATSFILKTWPVPKETIQVHGVGNAAEVLIDKTPGLNSVDLGNASAVVISSAEDYSIISIPAKIKKVFLKPEGQQKHYNIDGKRYSYNTIFNPDEVGENGALKGLSFVALSNIAKKHFKDDSFSYWYNEKNDYIDHVAEYYIDAEKIKAIAYGYEKPAWGGKTYGKKRKLPVVAVEGENIFVSLETKGRSGVNPALDNMIHVLLTDTDD